MAQSTNEGRWAPRGSREREPHSTTHAMARHRTLFPRPTVLSSPPLPLASPVRRPASRPLVRNVAASCPGPVLALSASSGTPLEENEGRHHHCVTGSSAACNTHRVGRCTVQTILGRSRGGSPPSKQRPGPSYESVLQGIFDGTPPRDRKLSRPRFSDRALSLAGIGR